MTPAFWLGLAIGLFLGAPIGFFAAGLCYLARAADDVMTGGGMTTTSNFGEFV